MGPRSFNRGNRHAPREVNPDGRGFNGAAVFQPRKCCQRPAALPQDARFNGAAVFQPRKSTDAMIRANRRCRFNGAAVFQPRKCSSTASRGRATSELQWGRGLSTAEILLRDEQATVARSASMGPRFFNRGNRPTRWRRADRVIASMGPRSFNRGNWHDA